MDDTYLQRAVIAVPKHSILLIEDIDCAFPLPRDATNFAHQAYARMYGMAQMETGKSRVTFSGLLNVLDGVGSEEGKIFFATVSHPSDLFFYCTC
jgi:chaperone BCS1